MKVTVVYICVTHGVKTLDFAARFAGTYHEFPPGVSHNTVIACNGGPLSHDIGLLFGELKPVFWPRQNDGGWDISAYIDAAKTVAKDCDMLVCLGESNYFHRQGWLKRLVECWEKHGPGMYGPYATNVVRGHLQTTAFCCSPKSLRDYFITVNDRKSRYEFEHGDRSLWRQMAKRGQPVRMVTWDGEYGPSQWRVPDNILWKGDQSNLLMWSNHSDRYKDADQKRKVSWEKSANRPFV